MQDLEEKKNRFLKTTKKTPPRKDKAKELFDKYVEVLDSMSDEHWIRFFKLLEESLKPSEMAGKDRAVAELHPADNAFHLLEKARENDLEWYKRYRLLIIKAIAWVVGLPIVGGIIEWLLSSGGGVLGFLHYPDIFQAEEYVFLALLGAWISVISRAMKL